MKKIKLTQVQSDKVSQILIEENRLKQEFQKVTGRKNDLVELILDAQGFTVEQLAEIKSYNFTGGEEGSMFMDLVETSDVPPMKVDGDDQGKKDDEPNKKIPPNKKKD